MRRSISLIVASLAATLALGCGQKEGEGSGAPSASPQQTSAVATTTTTAAPAATTAAPAAPTAADTAAAATPTAADTAAAAAAPTGTAAAGAGTAAAGAGTAAAGAGTAGAAAGPKTFDCGAKGQKPCPMQGWMKSVMASASSSGNGEKLANALAYVAGKAPPGMGQWSAISNAGVAAAKKGDIDGAKATCKQCHDLYKAKYVSTMRDRPW
ncbi:MAG TPA: hypothetical protein VE093_35330 [Polyangiaceae bacterium]|nr:hypothetical protein [Polyangiaceae bacterium]